VAYTMPLWGHGTDATPEQVAAAAAKADDEGTHLLEELERLHPSKVRGNRIMGRWLLGGAQHSMVPIISEGSSLIPGKWLHHQSSSSSHDASPHPQGERPAPGRIL
jgi:hypothetical protein